MLSRFLIVFAILSVLFGCAVSLPPLISKTESVASVAPVAILLIPSPEITDGDVPVSPEALASTIRFNNYRIGGEGSYATIESLKWRINGARFGVEKYRALLSRGTGSVMNKVSIDYDGAISMARFGANYQLAFDIENKVYTAQPDALSGKVKYAIGFPPSEVLENLANAKIAWKFHVDSEFNSDSTFANFSRMARREVFGGSASRNSVSGKLSEGDFWVRVENTEIPVRVETYPYRNGSKVVVYAVLGGAVVGNTIDFVSVAEALRKEIERIVNS